MKTEILSQEKNVVVIKAQYDAEEVKKAVDRTCKELSEKANIKGFRKGHVPRKTLELYFGKKGIYGEVLEDIIPTAVNAMIDEYELKLITDPNVDQGELVEGSPFEMTVTFEVSPEVTMPSLESLEFERTVSLPSEDDLNKNIEQILDAHSELVPTYEDRETTSNDYVSVKYTSNTINEDGSMKPVETDQKTEINLAQKDLRPEFANALCGKKPGDEVTVEFELLSDPDAEESPLVKMSYSLEILGIMKKETPELTDETVTMITNSKHNSVEEFKNEVMSQLKAAADRESGEQLKSKVVDKIVELSEVEIPAVLIENQKVSIRADRDERFNKAMKMTYEEYADAHGLDKEKEEADLEKLAEDSVKRTLVLEAAADANEVQWTIEEVDAEIARMAASGRMDPKKLREYIMSDRERALGVASMVRNRKTIDFLVTSVKVKDVEDKKTEETKSVADAE